MFLHQWLPGSHELQLPPSRLPSLSHPGRCSGCGSGGPDGLRMEVLSCDCYTARPFSLTASWIFHGLQHLHPPAGWLLDVNTTRPISQTNYFIFSRLSSIFSAVKFKNFFFLLLFNIFAVCDVQGTDSSILIIGQFMIYFPKTRKEKEEGWWSANDDDSFFLVFFLKKINM